MKTILIQTQKTFYKKLKAKLPFYSFVQMEASEIYVKIDENYFYQIEIFHSGKVKLLKCSNHGYIAQCWFESKSNESVWIEALEHTKLYINQF